MMVLIQYYRDTHINWHSKMYSHIVLNKQPENKLCTYFVFHFKILFSL